MSTAGITVTGLNECVQMMEDAPGNIVALGYARATNAAMNVVAEAVISRTPVEHGDLAKALVINVKVDPPPSAKGGAAELGFGKQDHIAMWVEYGHAMVGHRPGKKDLGTIPPHPFMRPGFDASADAAVDAFAESLAATLRQEY